MVGYISNFILNEAAAAHRRGLLVTESNILMKVYQEIKKENDLIKCQIINSPANIKCRGECNNAISNPPS